MLYAGITGFAEPLGALIGYIMVGTDDPNSLENRKMFGWLFGITAGIMTEVAVKSLLLESVRYDPTDRIVSKAWIFGALVIAISLIVIDMTSQGQRDCLSENALNAALENYTNISEDDLQHLCPLLH
jgi:zinc transporter ZupT